MTFGLYLVLMKMMRTNEVAVVEAGFGKKGVWPLSFVWEGRRHEVKRVTMRWEERNGGKKYACFTVDTGGMVAELMLDRENLEWRLGTCEPSCI